MKPLSLLIALLAFSTLDADEVNRVGTPEGTVTIYKQADDIAREIEVLKKNHYRRRLSWWAHQLAGNYESRLKNGWTAASAKNVLTEHC